MRLTVKRSGLYFLLVLLVGTVALSSPVPLAQQTSDAALPELSRAEMENFLLTAKIVKQRSLSIGITGSERATLTDGRLTHDAHIQTVDVRKASYTTLRGTELTSGIATSTTSPPTVSTSCSTYVWCRYLWSEKWVARRRRSLGGSMMCR